MSRRILFAATPLVLLLVACAAFYYWAGSSRGTPAQWTSIYRYPGVRFHQDETGILKIMTYNIGYLSGMTNNLPVRMGHYFYSRNMSAVQDYLRGHPVDIAVFQEIDFNSHRSYRVDQLDTIAQSLEFPIAARVVNWDKRYVPFPFWPPAVHFGPILSGQGAVSRFPVISNRRIQLAGPDNMSFIKKRFYLHRLAQILELDVGGRTLVVVNVHFEAFYSATRRRQALQVLDICRKYKNRLPLILLGDFNSVPPDASRKKGFKDEPEQDYTGDDTIRLLLEEEDIASAMTGTPTFPSESPDRQLDYIFFTPRWIICKSAYTVPLDSSDHVPLVMEFTLL